MPKSSASESPNRVLSAAFLERHSNKNDLLRRLRKVVEALSDEDVVEEDPSDFPGLDGLAAVLVEDRFLNHRDKVCRLHTVVACMEIFSLYAPDPPWDEAEILRVFSQMIRQLANLTHCTSPTQANYDHYYSLLEKLSVVKIGVILVELCRTLDSSTSPSGTVDGPSREDALEMLSDLIRTILQCAHIDHPPEVASHAVAAVCACIEEFEGMVPITVLDEILIAISAGPVVFVTNPAAVEAAAKSAAAKKKGQKTDDAKMPPMQIQQTNPSYMVAANIIRRSVDRISTPIANFLNGILSGDPNILSQTNISSDETPPASSTSHFSAPEKQATADVWTIIYELHRIAPQILTTVVGTVTNSLEDPNLQKRLRVTKLLGRLFYAPSSRIGSQFGPCYREWTRRCNDANHKVRLVMVKCLVSILSLKGDEETLAKEASTALAKMMEHDPNLDVRLQAIHQVCDLAYKAKNKNAYVSARLLQAVGNRVGSKNKMERRDALTGLAQIYHRHYVVEKLKHVQSGGEDCDIGVILDALQETCHSGRTKGSAKKQRRSRASDQDEFHSLDEEGKYNWIPRKVFESACFTDAEDTEMRNRVVQIVDDVLLGSTSDGGKGKKEALSPTSKAVGLAFIVDSLRYDDNGPCDTSESNAYKWMMGLFANRASLQRALRDYIDARAKIRATEKGTEAYMTAEAEAMVKLEMVSSLSAPLTSSGANSSDIRPILEKLHTARDKHIFRILATIASPTHSLAARARAFDELPKRTKSLGEMTAAWIKTLARRCAMGHFLNSEIINHCILLAQECFHEEDFGRCVSFLACVKIAAEIYPSLCGSKEAFGNLVELFSECQQLHGKKKKEVDKYGIVTLLSSVLASAAPTRDAKEKITDSQTGLNDSDLQGHLLHLVTKDGTPEQAKHAVFTMSALFGPSPLSDGDVSQWTEDQSEFFSPLMKALTAHSRLTLKSGESENEKIVCSLAALAALAETAPAMFSEKNNSVGNRGSKAVKFALETCLVGRSSSYVGVEDPSDSEGEAGSEVGKPRTTPNKKRDSNVHLSPTGASILEDDSLSLTCRRLCAAIEFLVTRVRYAVVKNMPPSGEHMGQLVSILCQIIHDGGMPPSSRDRRAFKARQDRAALRQCSARHLLRLCDARLKLENTFLTSSIWQTLSGIFLDEEKTVRDSVMEELCSMLLGQDSYLWDCASGSAFAPSLRLVSFIVLCTDGDHSAAHSIANGNAANVGKRSLSVKQAAAQCFVTLRKTSDATLAQCRALGRDAEKQFESKFKMMLMPEYAVPYALHLLAFRRETPSAGGSTGSGLTQAVDSQTDEDGGLTIDEESQHKVLRKRLKWLFEPLVLSLGDGADNISFLLRMTEVIGNGYMPRDVSGLGETPVSLSPELGNEDALGGVSSRNTALAAAKLKIICVAAREVLLSFVKKDVNLTPYPGAIQLPSTLFTQLHPNSSREPSLSLQSVVSSRDGSVSSRGSSSIRKQSNPKNRDSLDSTSPRGTRKGAGSRSSLGSSDGSASLAGKSHVHFSPELVTARYGGARSKTMEDSSHDEHSAFGGLSPIGKSNSPRSPMRDNHDSPIVTQNVSSEEKTLGTTPPSILQTVPNDESPMDHHLSLSASSIESVDKEKSPGEKSQASSKASIGSADSSKKRKRIGRATNTSRANKKASKALAKVEIRPSTDRTQPSASAQRGSRRKRRSRVETDEFDFDDVTGTEKENSVRSRSQKKSKPGVTSTKQRSKASAKHAAELKKASEGKNKRSTGRNTRRR